MASLTWWTWVWVNSGSWWWTGRPGVLRFMGLQRVGDDWATELNWTELNYVTYYFLCQWYLPKENNPEEKEYNKCIQGITSNRVRSIFPGGASGKVSTCQCRRRKKHGFNPRVGKIPWRRARQPTPVFLPGKSHGQRSLVGYHPWGHKELDMTEVTYHTCIAELRVEGGILKYRGTASRLIT